VTGDALSMEEEGQAARADEGIPSNNQSMAQQRVDVHCRFGVCALNVISICKEIF